MYIYSGNSHTVLYLNYLSIQDWKAHVCKNDWVQAQVTQQNITHKPFNTFCKWRMQRQGCPSQSAWWTHNCISLYLEAQGCFVLHFPFSECFITLLIPSLAGSLSLTPLHRFCEVFLPRYSHTHRPAPDHSLVGCGGSSSRQPTAS